MNAAISLIVGTLLTVAIVGLTVSYGIIGFSFGVLLFLIALIGAK